MIDHEKHVERTRRRKICEANDFSDVVASVHLTQFSTPDDPVQPSQLLGCTGETILRHEIRNGYSKEGNRQITILLRASLIFPLITQGREFGH